MHMNPAIARNLTLSSRCWSSVGFASNEQSKPVLNLFCYLKHPFSFIWVWYGVGTFFYSWLRASERYQ